MNNSNLSDSAKKPTRLPIVVRAGDLQALADRLDRGEYTPRDLDTAARLARHAAVTWVGGFAAVSLK
jgi:hypothetical protein